MANAIQRYVNSKLCCFSNSVHTSDKRIKYGLEEAKCQIIKDTIADIYMEILTCSPVYSDVDWYELILEIEFVQPSSPVALPGFFTLSDDPEFTSVDGTLSLTIPWSGTYYATDMENVNTIILGLLDGQGNADFQISTVFNTTTGLWNIRVTYSSVWGVPDERWVISPTITSNVFDSETTVVSDEAVDMGVCISLEEACDMKSYMDAYCKTCNKDINTPKPIV